MSKIEKSRSKKLKRRRPSKKLVANLDSLADALPSADEDDDNDDDDTDMTGSPKRKRSAKNAISGQMNIIKQKSLKHKPGAMKKKEKLDRMERDRFSKNLAQMSSVPAVSTPAVADGANSQPAAPTSTRWAALRNFISQTMEQNPEFAAKGNQ